MHVERDHDAAAEGHRRLRDKPVPAHLRFEPAQPRAEVHPLRVELDRGVGVALTTPLIVEVLILEQRLQIPERLPERAPARLRLRVEKPVISGRLGRRGRGIGRRRRRGRLRPLHLRGGRALDLVERVALRIRIGLLRLRRLLDRGRLAVQIGRGRLGRRRAGRQVPERLDALDAKLLEIKALSPVAMEKFASADDATMAQYLAKMKAEGELAAMRWLVNGK